MADSTRGGHNDYLDWLHGEVPLNRWAMAHGATPNGWIGRPSHLPEEQTHAFWCVSEAINFLQRRDPSAPFFLKVSFIDPHPPFTPPSFFYDRYDRRELPAPAIGDWADPVDAPTRGIDIEMQEARSQGLELDAPQMHACRAGYFGLINHVDMQISRLLQYMNDMRLLDDTLVVFVSDHGEMLGDHRLFHKSWPYEAAARVPLLVQGPPSVELSDAYRARGAGGSTGCNADDSGRGWAGHSGIGDGAQPDAVRARGEAELARNCCTASIRAAAAGRKQRGTSLPTGGPSTSGTASRDASSSSTLRTTRTRRGTCRQPRTWGRGDSG